MHTGIEAGLAHISNTALLFTYPAIYNTLHTIIEWKVAIIGSGGTMMLDEPVTFTFTWLGK